MISSKVELALPLSRLASRVLSGLLLTTLVLAGANAIAQTTSTQQPPEPPTPPVEQRPKQEPQTRSTTLAATADSSAGSIGGTKTPEGIKVSSGGAATYSIPIIVPPGTAGVAPKLAFNYNSQGENGLLGVGWSVSGLPVVHRCEATYAQDGFNGGIHYDGNDRFCLDGARLMVISGSYGGDGSEYRTEVDSFVRVTLHGTPATGTYFKVWTKSGEVMEFGNSTIAPIPALKPRARPAFGSGR